ncbi:cyclophilin-like fold protein [Roseimicrobium sp. ORNL1]|uniref:cyclophilin-like fold protein n=1 Tax=Roseimicrobium sp. ORNL1 TaxID=2711231 RepID=UPI0013E159BE|nr:cyclophilin-like fold protein [Roseimicrobium sp. ORNL1]QIF05492.1 hypothetical protein G5S37_29670 [Roseimicrobium sp. ORNL1]
MKGHILLTSMLAMTLVHPAAGADKKPPTDGKPMKIALKVNDRSFEATLLNNQTARNFASLLPLTLTMNDLFSREKFAHLPRAISTGGERTFTYSVGDIAYWSPGGDVALFYRHDGQEIPKPGLILIGRMDVSADAFKGPGSVQVRIEAVNK